MHQRHAAVGTRAVPVCGWSQQWCQRIRTGNTARRGHARGFAGLRLLGLAGSRAIGQDFLRR